MKRQNVPFFTWVMGALFAFPVFLFMALPTYGPEARVLAWSLAAISTLPFVLYLRGPRGIPIIEGMIFTYAVAFALAVFSQASLPLAAGPWVPPQDSIIKTLMLAMLGVVAMYVGARFTLNIFKGLPLSMWRVDLVYDRAFVLGIFLIIGWAFLLINLKSTSTAWFQPLYVFLNVNLGLAIICVGYFRGVLKRWQRIPAVLGFTLPILVGLHRGVMLEMFMPFIIGAFCALAVRRRLPTKMVLGLAAIFFILQPVKGSYRSEFWYRDENAGFARRFSEYGSLLSTYWSDRLQGKDVGGSIQESAGSRLGNLLLVAHIVDSTPDRVSFLYGSSFKYIIVSWIPRFVWRDKPIAQQANIDFAVDYGLLNQAGSQSTMVGITHLGEAYANFATLGVFLIFALIGVVVALPLTLIDWRSENGGGLIVVLAICGGLLETGSSIAGTFSGLPQQIAVQTISLWLFTSRRKRTAFQSRLDGRRILSRVAAHPPQP